MLKFAIAFLLGITTLQLLPDLSIAIWLYWLTIIFAILSCNYPKVTGRLIFRLVFAFLLGISYISLHASLQIAKAYPVEEQKKTITVIGKIIDLPIYKQGKVKFNFLISNIIQPTNSKIKPGLVHLSWRTTKLVQTGEQWQLAVRLKRPRGFANLGSFDLEKNYFSKHIIATGYVLDKRSIASLYQPKKIYNKATLSSIYDFGYKLRQYFHDNIINVLAGKEFQGIILALVTGVQHKISPQQLTVFRDIGIAHLLAISGLHIGFVAGIAFIVAGLLWRLIPRRWLTIPAPVVGAIVAIMGALAYAYLAGFSVATKRACIMVTMAMLGLILRRIILPADIFAYALLIILLLDPFTTLTLSFWLSFVAVALLLYAFVGSKVNSYFDKWIKPGLVITVGTTPLLLANFYATSLIAPIANFIAIPLISWVVVPVSLLAAMLYPSWHELGKNLWYFADLVLQWLWPILQTLQQLPHINWQPIVNSPWQLCLAFIGALWLLAPKGFPGKIFGLCGFLPLLFPIVHKIPEGEIYFTLLDVGQGLATVVETRNHVLVYDTGPKFDIDFDAGEQVVWPFLRAKNINHIDKLIISHADLDHSGGMYSLVNHIMPQQILTPKPELLLGRQERTSKINNLQPELLLGRQELMSGSHNVQSKKLAPTAQVNLLPCIAGQSWQWDGVYFMMLHPSYPVPFKTNEQSCVLHIKTSSSSILLTGDIGVSTEKKLISKYKNSLPADIVIVPHHGSRSSSSLAFIVLLKAQYALASVGYLNQYRHPNTFVINNYLKQGAKFLDTAQSGAISFQLGGKNKQLQPNCYRINHQKVWSSNNS